MKKMILNTRFVFVLLLCGLLAGSAPRAAADNSLAIPVYGQERDNWCWNASCQMILNYFGTTVSQTEIADWAVGGRDVGNNLDVSILGLLFGKKGCKQVLKHFGDVTSDATGRLSKEQVRQELDRNRPAILAIYWTGGGGHAVVLRGYVDIVGDLFLDIADPWPLTGRPSSNDPDTGSAALVLYEAVASGPRDSAQNYQFSTNPARHPGGTAAVGNNWGGTLKTTRGLDIAFVIDTTGSMGDDITQVKNNASAFINTLAETYSDLRIAVVDYKDFPVSPYGSFGDYVARTVSAFSTNPATAIAAINSLTVGGGNDTPESVYSALMHTLDGSTLGNWREDSGVTKRIIILGDAPGHDPEPWAGGYSYLDVLFSALFQGIRIDSIISGSGSGDTAALASLGAVASGTGGGSYPAGIAQIGNTLRTISSNLTEEARSPRGNSTSIRPVFTFSDLPETLMDAPVKKSFLEIQARRPGHTNWFRYKKIALKDTTYLSPRPFPTNSYRWRLAWQSSGGRFLYPNGDTVRNPGGSFQEDSWTDFNRAFSAPGAPNQLSPRYIFTATNTAMKYHLATTVNADAYAVRIFRGSSINTANLFKTLTLKAPRGTNNTLNFTVKGHKVGDTYRWQVQGLNYDRPKPGSNSWSQTF